MTLAGKIIDAIFWTIILATKKTEKEARAYIEATVPDFGDEPTKQSNHVQLRYENTDGTDRTYRIYIRQKIEAGEYPHSDQRAILAYDESTYEEMCFLTNRIKQLKNLLTGYSIDNIRRYLDNLKVDYGPETFCWKGRPISDEIQIGQSSSSKSTTLKRIKVTNVFRLSSTIGNTECYLQETDLETGIDVDIALSSIATANLPAHDQEIDDINYYTHLRDKELERRARVTLPVAKRPYPRPQ